MNIKSEAVENRNQRLKPAVFCVNQEWTRQQQTGVVAKAHHANGVTRNVNLVLAAIISPQFYEAYAGTRPKLAIRCEGELSGVTTRNGRKMSQAHTNSTTYGSRICLLIRTGASDETNPLRHPSARSTVPRPSASVSEQHYPIARALDDKPQVSDMLPRERVRFSID
jgi:hypothetical protein